MRGLGGKNEGKSGSKLNNMRKRGKKARSEVKRREGMKGYRIRSEGTKGEGVKGCDKSSE